MSRRLIEEAFPLKKVSEDSRHEKSVRHGHISTLHIWPARRPLAACRAALIAALLPDPGTPEKREAYLKRIASITRWGTENGPELDLLAEEIHAAYGGRAPRVLDPFAGGGAIPFEAMRLGCDVTAVDYNPVAWFILQCALDYPRRLAGRRWALPDLGTQPASKGPKPRSLTPDATDGDLEAHVRLWGQWVLARARGELERYYPEVDGHPAVAYLWARTVPCQDPACAVEIPLLRTVWLCKKKAEGRRPAKLRALRLLPRPEERRVDFEVFAPESEGELPARGTMARTGVTCPCCGAFMRDEYVAAVSQAGRLGAVMTAVVVDTPSGKEYRAATDEDRALARSAADAVVKLPQELIPNEPLPPPGTLGFRVQRYGFKRWRDLFTPRQILALATFVRLVRQARAEMERLGYPVEWSEAVTAYLAAMVDRLADYNSTVCMWLLSLEAIAHTFTRFALPMVWDFAETNPVGDATGGFSGAVDWVAKFVGHATQGLGAARAPSISCGTAEALAQVPTASLDCVVTDPPYYDAIPYGDLSDFFYVWLRRSVADHFPEVFSAPTAAKDGELVQKPNGDGGPDRAQQVYEDGMARAFGECCRVLRPDGTMVIVFAHKDPAAWETLVTAMIRAGFTVTASWPIDTERAARVRANASAALASSVWLVCEKRPATAGTGRYAEVRRAMQERITERLRYFWDQGLAGPDFVWAAIGPALESYSRHTAVRRIDGSEYRVSEFLREVRRLVTDFALGQILHGTSTETVDEWTRYYLMHRHSFGLGPAPAGECILLAQGYGLDLGDLRGPRGIFGVASKQKPKDDDNGDEDAGDALAARGSGSELRLLGYDERRRADLGEPHPQGGLPYVDGLHRLLQLWAAGNNDGAHEYVRRHGLRENDPFWAVAQAVLEMAEPRSRERSHLEAVVAWGRGRPATPTAQEQSFLEQAGVRRP